MHPSNWVAIIKTDQKIEVELCCRKLTDIDAFNEYAKKLCIVKASKAFPVDGNKSIEDEDKDILSQQSVVGVKKNGDLFILNLCQFSELCKQISEYKLKNGISDALKKKTGEAKNTISNPKKNKTKYN